MPASAFALALVLALSIVLCGAVQAQTFTVLHSFTGGADGARPAAGLTLDAGGNLYGTASEGSYTGGYCYGLHGCGTVFRLKPGGGGWTLSTLYTFHGNDGAGPNARVIFGPDGTLYGTTSVGGTGSCYYDACGTVFNLRPAATICKSVLCPWTETVLWNFMNYLDGNYPGLGDLIFDAAGHVYGTTSEGGEYSNGTVFELEKLPDGDWSQTILYNFTQISGQGATPEAGVIFDSEGNMYTPTVGGGFGGDRCGDVVQLVNSPSGWTENVLYTFTCSPGGQGPAGGVFFDPAGNLVGATAEGGGDDSGIVYDLSPSNGSWAYNILYDSFSGGAGPSGTLTMDSAGNLYGTTYQAGNYGYGSVFKLTPSDGSWTYTSLHDFTGGSDGANPVGNVIFDGNGNMYGTASAGGAFSNCDNGPCGVVWEITP